MLRYTLKRLLSLCISLAVASVVIFAVIEVAPGDPAAFMLGMNAQPETLAALRAELGLDVSKPARYLAWVSGMLTGDFGTSYTYRTPVIDMVSDRMWVSLPLALYALTLSTLVAFPAGIYAASRRGQAGDIGVMGATQLGVAVPNFFFAGLHALTLPAIALALPQAAILARVMRSSLLDVLGEDFMRTARAKGLSERQALWRHGLRNAMIPVLTIIGLQFSFLLAGSIIIEQVFYLPGLGRLVFQSISARDLIVVESVVMLLVFSVIMVNFLVDLAYAAVDPRLRSRT
jgi:peptide/nickel transport system permease protein